MTRQRLAAGRSQRSVSQAAPTPSTAALPACFCACFQFPSAVVAYSPGVRRADRTAADGGATLLLVRDEHVHRLWRARLLVETSPGGSSWGDAAGVEQPPRWGAELLQGWAASTTGLDLPLQLSSTLQQLAASRSHMECHAALRRLALLCSSSSSNEQVRRGGQMNHVCVCSQHCLEATHVYVCRTLLHRCTRTIGYRRFVSC